MTDIKCCSVGERGGLRISEKKEAGFGRSKRKKAPERQSPENNYNHSENKEKRQHVSRKANRC